MDIMDKLTYSCCLIRCSPPETTLFALPLKINLNRFNNILIHSCVYLPLALNKVWMLRWKEHKRASLPTETKSQELCEIKSLKAQRKPCVTYREQK